jgi:hypothetical protein
MEMKKKKPVPIAALEFDYSQFHFKQVHREENIAIYEQWKHGRVQTWEVVRIRIAPACTYPNGASYPEREIYPYSESWGVNGFTCITFERAIYKAQEMLFEA